MKGLWVQEHEMPSHSRVVLNDLNLLELFLALSLPGGPVSFQTYQVTFSR